MKNPQDYKSIIECFTKAYNTYLAAEPPYKAAKQAYSKVDSSIFNYDYLVQLTTYLGHLPILRNEQNLVSPSLILNEIKGSQLESALQIAYLFPRSKFIKSMIKTSTLGSLTPLAMYALKRDEGIMYEEWDKQDKLISRFLGKPLVDIYLPYTSTKEHCLGLRKEFKDIHKYPFKSSYTINAKRINKMQAIMLAQVWLANVQFRDTESMILDPSNWDNVPDAFDSLIIQEEKPEVRDKKLNVNDWLDW